MNYEFPIIKHLDDVRPAIEGRTDFVIAERDWGTVVCYIVAMSDTFPEIKNTNDAIRREARGLIFCKNTGRIVRRPLVKFFNILEKEETQLHNLDFSVNHTVQTKMDGSLISPFEVGYGSGHIRWGTKMGITEVAMEAEVFVANNPNYQKFAEWCIQNDLTPIFEYTAPTNRIVLRYNEPMLTLLAVRHMITGEYVNVKADEKFQIPVVETHDPIHNPKEFMEYVRNLKNIEGFVVAWDNGYRVKIKTEEYVRIHKAKDAISFEKNVISMIVNGEVDDVKAMLPEEDRVRLEKFEAEFWHQFNHSVRRVQFLLDEHKKQTNGDRRDFAINRAPMIHAGRRQIIFACWDGEKNVRDCLLDLVKKKCYNQSQVDSVRWVFGANNFWNRSNVDA